MNPSTNFIQITPRLLHMGDVNRAVALFTDFLGFGLPVRMEGYASSAARQWGCAFGRQTPNRPVWSAGSPTTVRQDVDALFAELNPNLDTLPAGDVHGPENQT